jgi:hypothetical protein
MDYCRCRFIDRKCACIKPILYLLYKEEKEKKTIRWIAESTINYEPKFPINFKCTHTSSISSLHTQLTYKKFVDTGQQISIQTNTIISLQKILLKEVYDGLKLKF